jgi:hypothetical protein
MVLWSKLGRAYEVASGKCGHEKKEGPQVFSEERAGEASNLMRRPVQQGSRNATTSACVGWDLSNIENQLAFRKDVPVIRFDRSHC